MLILNEKQLEFLIIVDMQDDWHPAYFLEKVAEHYENSEEKPIERPDFENMMTRLKTLRTERIANQQKLHCALLEIYDRII